MRDCKENSTENTFEVIPERLASTKTKENIELLGDGSALLLVTHTANWGKRLVLALLAFIEFQMLIVLLRSPGFTFITMAEPNYRSIYQLIN